MITQIGPIQLELCGEVSKEFGVNEVSRILAENFVQAQKGPSLPHGSEPKQIKRVGGYTRYFHCNEEVRSAADKFVQEIKSIRHPLLERNISMRERIAIYADQNTDSIEFRYFCYIMREDAEKLEVAT